MSKTKQNKKSALKKYTPEFRIQAIKLVLNQDQSLSQTAKDLGIPLATLHTWVRKVRKGEWTPEPENLTALKVERDLKPNNSKVSNISQKLHDQLSQEQKKNAELEKQVRRLLQERDVLKKAMAYCLDVPK